MLATFYTLSQNNTVSQSMLILTHHTMLVELEEGAELGRGGFCVVRDLARITLEKDPHQEVVVGENRDFVQGFSKSATMVPCNRVVTVLIVLS